MIDCCQCKGIESQFDYKGAKKEQNKYFRKGPRKTTLELINRISNKNINGNTLLDVGGGVGIIQYELLKNGISKAVSIDASSGYHKIAVETAEKLNLNDAITNIHGDFANENINPDPVDIVTMDRVICCYPDMKHLVEKSANACKHIYGLVFPRETFLFKLGIPIINFIMKIRKIPFRVFLHKTDEVHSIMSDNRFSLKDEYHSLLWQVKIYEK